MELLPSQYHPRRGKGYEAPVPRRRRAAMVCLLADAAVLGLGRAHWVGRAFTSNGGGGGAFLAIQVWLARWTGAIAAKRADASAFSSSAKQTRRKTRNGGGNGGPAAS